MHLHTQRLTLPYYLISQNSGRKQMAHSEGLIEGSLIKETVCRRTISCKETNKGVWSVRNKQQWETIRCPGPNRQGREQRLWDRNHHTGTPIWRNRATGKPHIAVRGAWSRVGIYALTSLFSHPLGSVQSSKAHWKLARKAQERHQRQETDLKRQMANE